MGLVVGHRTDTGCVRESNEDAYLAMTMPVTPADVEGLFVVADGVGGRQAGEIASGYVVNTIMRSFSSSAYQEWVEYSPEREDYYTVVLKEVLERINSGLLDMASRQPALAGMATTATVALLAGKRLVIGHVGDSRAYLVRQGKLQQLTQDHSWVEEQVRAGEMSPEEAANHPRRNVITRSLGNRPVVQVDRYVYETKPNDILLLCSDGITDKLSEAEILTTVQRNKDPQAACDLLVELAKRRGGEDNITVLTIRLTGRRRKSNLPGGIAIVPQPTTLRDEAAETKRIVHRKVRQPGLRPYVSIAWVVGTVAIGILTAGLAGAGAIAATSWLLHYSMDIPHLLEAIGWIAGLGTLLGFLVGTIVGRAYGRRAD